MNELLFRSDSHVFYKIIYNICNLATFFSPFFVQTTTGLHLHESKENCWVKEYLRKKKLSGNDLTDLTICNRSDTILCSRRAPANKRKLGQSPLEEEYSKTCVKLSLNVMFLCKKNGNSIRKTEQLCGTNNSIA